MKIVLFDTILERHLAESLARALTFLGHEVIYTDLLLHGHSMIEKKADLEFMWQQVEKMVELRPDLLIAFRPMNLNVDMLQRLKGHMTTAVWLSDDPVLYKTAYGRIVDHYDVILHCGSETVMSFYDKQGHCGGFNFPFWTDHKAFPSVYDPEHASNEVVFLGNMHGQVRRRRYFEFGGLPFTKKVFGLLDADPLGIHGGMIHEAYLRTEKVSAALADAKVGLSIPQFFTEYKGLNYDFEELAMLGYFQFPSRVIQYVASGLPVAAVGGADMKEVFPEIEVAATVSELEEFIGEICRDVEFARSKSEKTLARFRAQYSALSRAEMLLAIVADLDHMKQKSVATRARMFGEFSVDYKVDTY